jgi:D-3-phosphoglycerate dehydrogenase
MVEEVRRDQEGAYETYMRVTLKTERQTRSVAGTVFSDGRPRLIQMHGISFEAELTPHMLYTENEDKPGYIGALGTLLGETGVNVATFNLGRQAAGGKALALIGIDAMIEDAVLERVRALPNVMRANRLQF